MNQKNNKWAIYCRVSTVSQEEGTSLDTQETQCRALIEEHGGEVGHVLKEAMSGSLYLARSELQKAIALVESGEVTGLARGGIRNHS